MLRDSLKIPKHHPAGLYHPRFTMTNYSQLCDLSRHRPISTKNTSSWPLRRAQTAHAQNLAHVNKILTKLITYRKPLNPTNFDTLNHVSNFSNPSGIGKVAVRLGQHFGHGQSVRTHRHLV
eukprot:sb/3476045/